MKNNLAKRYLARTVLLAAILFASMHLVSPQAHASDLWVGINMAVSFITDDNGNYIGARLENFYVLVTDTYAGDMYSSGSPFEYRLVVRIDVTIGNWFSHSYYLTSLNAATEGLWPAIKTEPTTIWYIDLTDGSPHRIVASGELLTPRGSIPFSYTSPPLEG